ncbi:MAG: universal stress protein [Deltaproteobacteria bacterium]|nr:universal stress protein [Deltaproteobacteria bacterium]MBW1930802.1 universal stress protein [Deltaproteobacteria bacterium]MBW2024717.1 universal stress protein [Deltaproteobacteria bacterium]MBW2125478.1 universal stress protein [Deltaproteobacteria bacterium]RLB19075.1 MAG: hypothetical protein DRG63_01510 [Deltaproteobacteria bacterium]
MMKDGSTILVGIDFSYCSELALRKACEYLSGKKGRIIALHVIDDEFVKKCIQHHVGEESEIKRNLFVEAKQKLNRFIQKIAPKEARPNIELSVIEGIPYIEINKKAVESQVELIIIGSCAKDNNMNNIFFGSTAERVLRFITRPVLCVPPTSDLKVFSHS